MDYVRKNNENRTKNFFKKLAKIRNVSAYPFSNHTIYETLKEKIFLDLPIK